MTIDYRIISIGTLAAHPLWDEGVDVRTGHATTTLVEAGDVKLLVDPSLPPTVIAARMSERTRVRPDQVTHVFLTSFQPDRRRALELFDDAQWLIHEPEREAAGGMLQVRREEAAESGDHELLELLDRDRDLLRRTVTAPDRIAAGVDLFPLPGVTPGHCGLLLAQPARTVLICGDAVATMEHLEQGKVLPDCVDIETAQESFKEAIEIADVLVLGRDNVALNPVRS